MKTKSRSTKRPTSSKSTKAKAKVRSGGKNNKPVWYKRWRLYAFGVVFGVTGSAILLLTHAETGPVNCKSLASAGSTMNFCVATMPSYGALRATADYVAADTASPMTSGSLSLELCSPQTLICNPVDTSSQVQLYTASQPRYQHMYTRGVTLLRGAVYRTCLAATTKSGWSFNRECTQMLTYGNSVNNPPQAFNAPSQTTISRYATTTSSYPASECSSAPIKKPNGTPYQCTFDEEFNGTALDATKWSPLTAAKAGIGQGQDCFVDSPNNISVSGGALNLTSRKEATSFICTGRKIAPTRPALVTSGNVTTGGKFSQQYGRIELRAKIPDVKKPGLMQSFWLWPDKPYDQDPAGAPWPATGEIDIVEMFTTYPDRAIPNIHYVPDPADPNVTNTYCYIDRSQYHTYVLTWTPDTIRVDIDGYNCVLDHPKPKSPQVAPQPFNKSFYINLSSGLGVAGSANDYVEGSTPLPATSQVDYVRVWK